MNTYSHKLPLSWKADFILITKNVQNWCCYFCFKCNYFQLLLLAINSLSVHIESKEFDLKFGREFSNFPWKSLFYIKRYFH